MQCGGILDIHHQVAVCGRGKGCRSIGRQFRDAFLIVGIFFGGSLFLGGHPLLGWRKFLEHMSLGRRLLRGLAPDLLFHRGPLLFFR